MADDDLRKMLGDFRSSVSTEFAVVGGRLDRLEGRVDGLEVRVVELTDEMRTRFVTMETAILNSIRDLGVTFTRRLDDHERRIGGLED